MCLELNGSHREVDRLRKQKSPITVYKLLTEDDGKLFSIFEFSPWSPKRVKVSSRSRDKRIPDPTRLARFEINAKKVDAGLHFYMDLADAQERCGNNQVWAVSIQPQDIVAIGTFGGRMSLVAHRAKLIHVIE